MRRDILMIYLLKYIVCLDLNLSGVALAILSFSSIAFFQLQIVLIFISAYAACIHGQCK